MPQLLSFLLFLVTTTSITFILATSLNIQFGNAGLVNFGKDVRLFKMQAMAIGGIFGGVAGCLYSFLNGYISPQDCMPIETFILWAMVVVGGSGSVAGIVLGTLVVQTLYVGSRFLTHLV